MKLRTYIIAVFTMCWSFSAWAQAKDAIKVVTSELSPYSIEVGIRPGFMVEILTLIESQLGLKSERHYYPWARSQMLAQNNENHVIFPVTRTPERENLYDWAINVASIEYVFVTVGGRKLTLEEAKTLRRISVQNATPFEDFLKNNGFRNYVTSPDSAETHLRLLTHQRVQAWFTAKDLAEYALSGFTEGKRFTVSEPMSSSRVYIALSKKFPPSLKAEYIRVFNELKEDGTVDYILRQYRNRD